MKSYLLSDDADQAVAAALMGINGIRLSESGAAREKIRALYRDPDCGIILLSARLGEAMRREEPAEVREMLLWERPLVFILPEDGNYREALEKIPGDVLGMSLHW